MEKNKITDLNKHPEKDYGGSTAAGAYQIMRYTWWWLNGEKLTDKYKKAGIYEESHDYIKKYNITDFRQESQDKLCIIIMKHKRPGLLDLIKKGEIEKAIRSIASLEWASLPHDGDNSYYKFKGKPQPATPMKQCIEDFDIFFKEEQEGKSDLHLKKGFLREFGESCKCENNKDIHNHISPLKSYRITSHFDPNRLHPVSKKICPHNGTDMVSKTDDRNIIAPYGGKITQVKFYKDDANAGGNRVYMIDDLGYEHRFMHLKENSIVVKVNNRVEKGDKIAIMGNTGIGTGDHLHYEILKAGIYLNPITINEGLKTANN
ncbi:MAG: M23 family metallopeptidase [Tannerella sp.]|nr:M23 family metallopeptidase [Tannerella sp.]